MLTNAGGRYLGDGRFDPIFAELQRRAAVVFVHPTASPDRIAHTLDLPDSLLDYPVDTSRAIAKLPLQQLTSGPLNSSLSNSAWSVKAPALHAHSLLALNAEVSALPAWDVDDINLRGYAVSSEICAIWPSPARFGPTDPEDIPTLDQILADTAAAAAAATPSGTTVPIAALVRAGFLEEGETLISSRANVHETVLVLADGRLECGSDTFDSPSSAAAHCAGTSAENGWTFWMADRDGELVSLKDIRTQYLGAERNGSGSDRPQARHQYWSSLLELARSKTELHARVSPTTDSWISAGAGYSGVHYIYETRQHDGGIHLYLENFRRDQPPHLRSPLPAQRGDRRRVRAPAGLGRQTGS
jgi:hypothetical protein